MLITDLNYDPIKWQKSLNFNFFKTKKHVCWINIMFEEMKFNNNGLMQIQIGRSGY